MDLNIVTIQDCIENWQYKAMTVLLNDGAVLGFRGGDIRDLMGGEGNGIQDMSVLRGKSHKKKEPVVAGSKGKSK